MDSLEKSKAIVFRAKAFSSIEGIEPDLRACLCEEALRINVMSSVGDNSAIDKKCRGANGEVEGE